MKISQSKGLHM